MKVALVGLGGMGTTHYNLYRLMPDVEMVALVDVEFTRIEEKGEECGARCYTSLEEMLKNETPDFVDIATASYTHADIAMQVLKKRISVLVEKPAALCQEDVCALYHCARENKVAFMPAHVIRFWPEYQWLKDAVESGKYGRLRRIDFFRIGEKPRNSWKNWMLDPAKSGMVPYDLHIHDVDYMVYLLGMPETADAFEVRDGETTNFIHVNYRYADGVTASAKAAWYSGKVPFSMGYEALFDTGYAEYRNNQLTWYPNDEELIVIASDSCIPNGLSEINVGDMQGYYNEIRYFIHCMEEGTFPSVIKEEELLNVLKLLEQERKQYYNY